MLVSLKRVWVLSVLSAIVVFVSLATFLAMLVSLKRV